MSIRVYLRVDFPFKHNLKTYEKNSSLFLSIYFPDYHPKIFTFSLESEEQIFKWAKCLHYIKTSTSSFSFHMIFFYLKCRKTMSNK